ncbi:MAG: hypothetical protein N3G78_10160 [Desulfobacterota bacterium]|nr:hypothetical protein [Thermodesulfobacteriota bacterium]
MRKWVLLFFAMVLVVNLAAMGIGCKAKAPEKPAVKEEAKPAEAPAPAPEKPAEAPPAVKPGEAKPAEAPKK